MSIKEQKELIEILEWEEMISLSLPDKNKIYSALISKKQFTTEELEYLELLQEHLEDEYWECQDCGLYFYEDSKNLMYDPTTCPICIEDNVTIFGISYNKADMETRKWMNDVLKRERNIDLHLNY